MRRGFKIAAIAAIGIASVAYGVVSLNGTRPDPNARTSSRIVIGTVVEFNSGHAGANDAFYSVRTATETIKVPFAELSKEQQKSFDFGFIRDGDVVITFGANGKVVWIEIGELLPNRPDPIK